MKFGLYIGSVAGTESDLAAGKPDNPGAIRNILDTLQQGGRPLVIRGYLHYLGDGRTGNEAPADIIQYTSETRKIDLVLCYRSAKYDKQNWIATIRNTILQYGEQLSSIQITEEPNLKDAFAGDGSFENIMPALRDGVIAAKEEITKRKLPVKVGFNAVLSFNPADTFWNTIGSDDFVTFRESVDYIGLDFFPDVFRPIPEEGFPANLTNIVKQLLNGFRNTISTVGKISSSIPIRITENGWSTAGKSIEKQAVVLETIIRAVQEVSAELNIDQYGLFALRDTDSSNDNLFYQFGIVKDDYTPKPAFHIFHNLIKEMGDR